MLFKSTYPSPRKFVYVQLQLEQQEWQIRYVVVATKNLPDKVEWTTVDSAVELLKKAGKNLPYVLHFRGFGVLTRIVENVPNFKETLLVNGHEEDFYFNSMAFRGTIAVSFLRVSLVQAFMDELTAAKAFIWGLHAGPIPLLALLDRQDTTAQLDFTIEIANSDIRKLERNTGDEKRLAVPAGFLSTDEAYVNAFRELMAYETEGYEDGLPESFRTETRGNYKEFMRFVKLGVGMLSIFFFALLGNYFYVNHLNNKAAQLESDIAGFGEDLALIDRLEQEKSRKVVLVDNSGIQSSRYLTFYLDELGASVPASIQLEMLEAFPLTEALKPKRKVELNRQQISIIGYSSNSKVLDDWMEQLEQKKWVAGVELMNYVRINDKKATFNLLVKIRS